MADDTARPAPEDMVHIKLDVIPEPPKGTGGVMTKGDSIDPANDTLFYDGFVQGDKVAVSLDCGNCGRPLAIGMRREFIRGPVLKCAACGSFNAT